MNLNDYQNKVPETWISNDFDFERMVLGIPEEAGEICGLIKKAYRGDSDLETEKFLKLLRGEIGDISFYLAQVCNMYGFEWQNILDENIQKLQDRKKRGKIKGSGDLR